MIFEAARCPSCGASIQVPTESETVLCMFCGSTIVVKDAIKKLKIEISGQVNMSGISSVENDLALGAQSILAKDWNNAYRMYCSAISKKATLFEAWHGCLSSITYNFSWIDFSWVKMDGIYGIESVIHNCYVYADDKQKSSILADLKSLLENLDKQLQRDAEIKAKKGPGCFIRGLQVFGSLLVGFDGIGGLFMLVYITLKGYSLNDSVALNSDHGLAYAFQVGGVIGLIICLYFVFRKKNPAKYIDKQQFDRIERIRSVMRNL